MNAFIQRYHDEETMLPALAAVRVLQDHGKPISIHHLLTLAKWHTINDLREIRTQWRTNILHVMQSSTAARELFDSLIRREKAHHFEHSMVEKSIKESRNLALIALHEHHRNDRITLDDLLAYACIEAGYGEPSLLRHETREKIRRICSSQPRHAIPEYIDRMREHIRPCPSTVRYVASLFC